MVMGVSSAFPFLGVGEEGWVAIDERDSEQRERMKGCCNIRIRI